MLHLGRCTRTLSDNDDQVHRRRLCQWFDREWGPCSFHRSHEEHRQRYARRLSHVSLCSRTDSRCFSSIDTRRTSLHLTEIEWLVHTDAFHEILPLRHSRDTRISVAFRSGTLMELYLDTKSTETQTDGSFVVFPWREFLSAVLLVTADRLIFSLDTKTQGAFEQVHRHSILTRKENKAAGPARAHSIDGVEIPLVDDVTNENALILPFFSLLFVRRSEWMSYISSAIQSNNDWC